MLGGLRRTVRVGFVRRCCFDPLPPFSCTHLVRRPCPKVDLVLLRFVWFVYVARGQDWDLVEGVCEAQGGAYAGGVWRQCFHFGCAAPASRYVCMCVRQVLVHLLRIYVNSQARISGSGRCYVLDIGCHHVRMFFMYVRTRPCVKLRFRVGLAKKMFPLAVVQRVHVLRPIAFALEMMLSRAPRVGTT
mgnify:FL=1